MNSHQIVDIVVLAVLLYCAVKGASRGLLSQLAWVVALLLCFKFSGTLAPAIEPMINVAPPLKQWIAMLIVYVGLCGLSFVAAGMLSSWMEKAKVIDFDRHLGGVLGFTKGIVICMTGMFFAITMSNPMREIVSKTYSGYAAAVILNNSQYLMPLLPEHTVPTVRNVIDEFNRRLQPRVDDLHGAVPADPGDFASDLRNNPESDDFGLDLSDLLLGRNGEMETGDQRSDNAGHRDSLSAPTLQELMEQVPAQLRRELSQQAMERLRNSTPEQKQRLLEDLNSSAPENSGRILNTFLRSVLQEQGTSSEDPPLKETGATHPAARLGQSEETLLNEIAGIYSRRNDIAANARKYLAGVPGHVQKRVLEDWHADAMGLSSDPDPVTDINTRLDERIVRQLRLAGVSFDRLSSALRARLSETARTPSETSGRRN